jgi:hypothetical protein
MPPVTSVLDNFDRTNVGPPLSASWTNIAVGHRVYSNVCRPGGDELCSSRWNVATYGAACEVFVTCSTLPASNDFFEIGLRMANDDSDGYKLYYEPGELDIFRYDDTVYTQLGASVSLTISAGDKLWFSASGSSLNAYRYTSGAWGSSLAARTDATYSSAGYLGLDTLGYTVRLDDFGGGTLVTVVANPWYSFAQM